MIVHPRIGVWAGYETSCGSIEPNPATRRTLNHLIPSKSFNAWFYQWTYSFNIFEWVTCLMRNSKSLFLYHRACVGRKIIGAIWRVYAISTSVVPSWSLQWGLEFCVWRIQNSVKDGFSVGLSSEVLKKSYQERQLRKLKCDWILCFSLNWYAGIEIGPMLGIHSEISIAEILSHKI